MFIFVSGVAPPKFHLPDQPIHNVQSYTSESATGAAAIKRLGGLSHHCHLHSFCNFHSANIWSAGLADLTSITDYLLDLDKSQVYHLGVTLGLSVGRMKSTYATAIDSIAFLDEVVTAWLQRADQVEQRGAPSWNTLVAALRNKRVGQNGIAHDIEIKELSK